MDKLIDSYGIPRGAGPDLTPAAGQRVECEHSPAPLTALRQTQFYGLAGPQALALRVEVKGRARRVKDGALAALTGELALDHHGTLRTWLGVPIDPDYGRLKGNVLNHQHLAPVGSGWTGAIGQVTLTGADRDWQALGLLGQLTRLLRGLTMEAHDGDRWEVLVVSLEAGVEVSEVAGIKEGS